jgi:hypothetical protein
MSAPSTRRAALGAILAAPLAASPATAKTALPGISPELARLIRKSQAADDRLRAEDSDVGGRGFSRGSMRAAAALRCRVATFKSASMADVLAKARHTAAIWEIDCAQEEFEAATANGECYLDDMAHGVFLDLLRVAGEG